MPRPRAFRFQSTRPRRARPTLMIWPFMDLQFQSTRPRRARPAMPSTFSMWSVFQSTRPRRARQGSFVLAVTGTRFQSTRPRRARPARCGSWRVLRRVSIHAPTQGATSSSHWLSMVSTGFNPRAHAGRDPSRGGPEPGVSVSIHAPTQGATDKHVDLINTLKFQSTRPRRARRMAATG